MIVLDLLYSFILILIRAWKWGELKLINIFISPISDKAQDIFEQNGIVFHFVKTEEEIKNIVETEKTEKRVRKKCKNYNSLVHLKVYNRSEFFSRIVNGSGKGIAEAYMDGIFDCVNSQDDLVEWHKRIAEQGTYKLYYKLLTNRLFDHLELYAFNLQTVKRAFQVSEHYDLGTNLYKSMLGPTQIYTCAYWRNAGGLDEAQLAKLELIAKKLNLKPGMCLLDLGCGFGN